MRLKREGVKLTFQLIIFLDIWNNICGGQGVPAEDYCLKWDRERGIFSGTPVTRNIEITGLSCWDLGNRGVLFMGYNKADNSTTDLVADDGSSSSSSFTMKHKIM